MIDRVAALSLIACFVAASALPVAVAQGLPTWSSKGVNSIQLQAGASPAVTEQASTPLTSVQRGLEASQCEPWGRKSNSTAAADGSVSAVGEGQWRIDLAVASTANGGHYRNCVACPGGKKCVGYLPFDTKASAKADTFQVLDLQFSDAGFFNKYTVDISPSDVDGLSMTIRDASNNLVFSSDGEGGTLTVEASQGTRLIMETRLSAEAADKGECCVSSILKTAAVGVTVSKAAIIDSTKQNPYIRGGLFTEDFPEVVAIRLREATTSNRKTHCTGTIVGKRTILTAAHCISGFELAIQQGRMDVVVGSSIYPTDPGTVFDVVWPSDFVTTFDKVTLKDDVGLLYVGRDLPAQRSNLHDGMPDWASIIKGLTLAFVGFGYEMPVLGAPVYDDRKRVGLVDIDSADDLAVYFAPKFPEASPCKGDSGGPAFLDGPGIPQRTQMAITSGGVTSSCLGNLRSIRVDAYRKWIDPRIK